MLRANSNLNPFEAMLCYTVSNPPHSKAYALRGPIFHKLDETIRGHISLRPC